jgi:hypothetical protein
MLVDGAVMPRARDLPETLRGLARRQSIEISHTRFDADVERLTGALNAILDERRKRDAAEAEAAEQAEDESRAREAAEEAEKAARARQLAESAAAEQTRLGKRYRDGDGVEGLR